MGGDLHLDLPVVGVGLGVAMNGYAEDPGGRQDWQTPDNVLELVRSVYGGAIILDPCTVDGNPTGALTYFTPAVDGLSQPWRHGTFMNCPYGRPIGEWLYKAVREYCNGAEVLGLIPARTDTRWWHAHVTTADAICFWRGRLRFRGADAPAKFPSALPYWGPRVDKFREVFGKHGWIVGGAK